MFDRMPTNELPITQQRIGRLLGVRRESVTEAAFRLQREGAIHYHRGVISLLNRRKLEAGTCACYSVIKGVFMNLRA
jgi:Mn-dependent DtxR family transcriptional regulator